MSKTIVPFNYQSTLGIYDTQTAIGFIKGLFEKNLADRLHLKRVSAPLFVPSNVGLNDDLNGIESPVSFTVPAIANTSAEIVHSLAKWKRLALFNYDFRPGNGLYTDMNAIRKDEVLDNLHSIYVDQWDWERVITADDRHHDYLKQTVRAIVDAIVKTALELQTKYPTLTINLNPDVFFITSQELEDMYPDLDGKAREQAITQKHQTVFIMNIGAPLKSGVAHDGRAPDYDDWNLNGDLLFWHEPLACAMEISSMGIRVDAKALAAQLQAANATNRLGYDFHQGIINETLPLTIGGGIGQSRLCMLLLGKAHIGEVQVSLWDDETRSACLGHIELL